MYFYAPIDYGTHSRTHARTHALTSPSTTKTTKTANHARTGLTHHTRQCLSANTTNTPKRSSTSSLQPQAA
ncbi:hypothetical protein BD289DRAFT_447145 [Coniella lustricola]|uniref:Uncharacterized protein n=1 Tax=Coniella lustricola TaxID=2025994 RepID=A0A2T2ZTC6_9PEZI|nr:hypothetical protein BD289DRAFT_447145 [Coniella lustricola]